MRAVRVCLLIFTLAAGLAAQQHIVLRADLAKSEFHIELGRAGLLKAFGDDHLIRVTDYRCEVSLDEQTPAKSAISLTIRTQSLEVTDPGLAAEKRAEVQRRMQGPEVLDVARYPEIKFVSRRLTPAGNQRFRVEGDLRIRDSTRPVAFEVTFAPEAGVRHVSGEARVRQTDFGIQPVSAGAGTVKVKDEMKIVFHILLGPDPL